MKVHGVKNIPTKITTAETKSTALSISPVNRNKLFIRSNPPKKRFILKIGGKPNKLLSKSRAAHTSTIPKTLTITK